MFSEGLQFGAAPEGEKMLFRYSSSKSKAKMFSVAVTIELHPNFSVEFWLSVRFYFGTTEKKMINTLLTLLID